MPCYVYTCPECKKTYEKVLPMSKAEWTDRCECGAKAHRNLVAEHADGNVDSQNREYTMFGDSGCRVYAAAYLPQQKEEMMKNHPNREFKLVNGCYLPVIKHRQDFKKFLKERNYHEL